MEVYVIYDIEGAIKTFRERIRKDGILQELKSKQYFLSKSEKRKRKAMRARKREKARLRRQEARYEQTAGH